MQSGFRLRAEIAQDGFGGPPARLCGFRSRPKSRSHVHICVLIRARAYQVRDESIGLLSETAGGIATRA